MKSTRRHELQQNVLADWLGEHLEPLKPHAKTIGIGCAAFVVLVLSFIYFNSQQASQNSVSWEDYLRASFSSDPAELQEVADKHVGTTAGMWALQREGDVLLAEGISSLYTDRDEAAKKLNAAEEVYQALLKMKPREPELTRATLFGLAQACESQNKIDEAKTHYKQVIEQHSGSAFALESERRLETLDKDSTVAFYAWFESEKPRPRTPTFGGNPALPNLPDDLPTDLGELPDTPDLSFPGMDLGTGLTEPGSGTAPIDPLSLPEVNTEGAAAPEKSASPEEGATPAESTESDSPGSAAEPGSAEAPGLNSPANNEGAETTPEPESGNENPTEDN